MAPVSLSDNNCDGKGGGGSESSVREISTPYSESTQEQSKSLSSVWKPVWYTGWHTGVLACATSVMIVLFINVGLTIYVATNPRYKREKGTGTLYSGSCDKSRKIGVWLHLGINALSTLLLSGSSYTQQCLSAPTRSEIDAAHARRQWMDVGVPSVRNLFKIKPKRRWLWIAIGLTSIPLHLLYVYIPFPLESWLISRFQVQLCSIYFASGHQLCRGCCDQRPLCTRSILKYSKGFAQMGDVLQGRLHRVPY